MKLLACYIENFGKLSDMSLEFHEGVNLISGPNGWGKSTLAAFLKAMLYGFDNKKEEGAFEKERIMYTPWQGVYMMRSFSKAPSSFLLSKP